jgi:hypothetical protein
MIIREVKIQEAWCAKCAAGQMSAIHDIMMTEKIGLDKLIGRTIVCSCGHENEVEDVLSIMPTSFLVASQSDVSKVKSNEELNKWLNAE